MPSHSARAATLALILVVAAPARAGFNEQATVALRKALRPGSRFDQASLEVVKKAIADGADVNANPRQFNDWNSPLALAVAKGQPAAVQALIAAGAKVNDSGNGSGKRQALRTPLMYAIYPPFDGRNISFDLKADAEYSMAFPGSVGLVQLLFKSGANLDAQDCEGMTPLMMAVQSGQPKLVEELLLLGANAGLKNKEGQTAGQLCPSGRHYRKVHLTDRQAVEREIQTILAFYQQEPEIRALLAKQEPLPLPVTGIIAGYLFGERKALVPAGAGAGSEAPKAGLAAPVETKAQPAASVETKAQPAASAETQVLALVRNQALAAAVLRGQYRESEGLLGQGADPNHRDLEGRTPLMLAAMADRPRIVQLLLSKGADMDLLDRDKKTAYDHAFGCPEILRLIEERQNAVAGPEVD